MRSQLGPMKRVARSISAHRRLILNWFRAKGTVSAGAVEGLNSKVKLVARKSYCFRTPGVDDHSVHPSLRPRASNSSWVLRSCAAKRTSGGASAICRSWLMVAPFGSVIRIPPQTFPGDTSGSCRPRLYMDKAGVPRGAHGERPGPYPDPPAPPRGERADRASGPDVARGPGWRVGTEQSPGGPADDEADRAAIQLGAAALCLRVSAANGVLPGRSGDAVRGAASGTGTVRAPRPGPKPAPPSGHLATR
jgi:hypothetical protein